MIRKLQDATRNRGQAWNKKGSLNGHEKNDRTILLYGYCYQCRLIRIVLIFVHVSGRADERQGGEQISGCYWAN